ncbi:hypothetical protein D3C73_999600 [compost metagenome]
MQGFEQGQVVQLGVMAQANDATAQVGGEGPDHVVRHADYLFHARDIPAFHVFAARVADRHLEAVEQRHGRQVFGQYPGTDQQHAVAGAEGIDHALAIEAELLQCVRDGQAHATGAKVQLATDQVAGVQLRQKLLKAGQ